MTTQVACLRVQGFLLDRGTLVVMTATPATPDRDGSSVFVSYTAVDEGWATWIAFALEGAGLTARVQVWDSPPGRNFVEWMNRQLADARWTVAVYSDAYFSSDWCTAEWTAALARRTLLPVRVEPVVPPETLTTLTWVDLFGVDEVEARERLLHAVGVQVLPRLAAFPGGPHKTTDPPTFPGQAKRKSSVTPYLSELTTYAPIIVKLDDKTSVRFVVHGGPIEQLSEIDIVATSENVYFQMSQFFKPSTSGRLRRAIATKTTSGEILDDVASDELISWMRKYARYGLPVEPGTVAPTSSGALEERGILRVYHAAIVTPRIGTNDYDVNPHSIPRAVHNIFSLARRERGELGVPLTSICFPLFGAGRGGLSCLVSFERIWEALYQELRKDPTWTIHFVSWKHDEVDLIRSQLSERAD
jgi:hypothetical protein